MLRAPFSVLVAAALLLSAGAGRAQSFTKITGVPPVTSAGGHRATSWIDLEGDGDLDLYVTRGGAVGEHNVLYRNDGGSFVQDPASPLALDGIRADGCSWGDWDGDGDDDVFVVSWYGENNALFENLGSGVFQRVLSGPAVTTGTHSEDCAWADPDNDGDLDLFVANSGGEDNLFYRNDGSGTLTPLAGSLLANDGRDARHGAWADYDEDGDVDLFVVNEGNQANVLYQNQLDTGSLAFVAVAAGDLTSDLAQSFSASWGDHDNDGDLDLVVANMNGQANAFYRNELVETGTASFTKLAEGPALHNGWTFGSGWGDVDNDADLDLFLTNGFGTAGQTRKNWLYRNDGGNLVRVVVDAIHGDDGWSYGAAFADFDGDGDLDLHVANWLDNQQECALYRNDSESDGNHWLTLDLVGTVSNSSGIGAVIRAVAVVSGSPVRQTRVVSGSDGQSSHNLRQHFGLGDATTVDSLVVRWPSGTVQVLESVAADQHLTVTEPAGAVGAPELAEPPRVGLLRGASPNPFRGTAEVRWQLPSRARVELDVRDVGGRVVRVLARGSRAPGSHATTWDGRDADGRTVASGVYFVRLRVEGGGEESLRLLRLR